MRKHAFLFAMPLVMGASLAQADSILPFTSYQDAEKITPAGGNFSQELAVNYKDFSLFEAKEMNDWPDAELFARKALQANDGQAVAPEEPANWDLTPEHLATLTTARGKLVSALDGGGRDRAPDLAALAQAKYDCWVEQQEENHQPDHIAACRTEFEAAMAKLEGATAPAPQKVAAAPAAPEPKVDTGPKVEVGEEIARTVVYFDWNKSELNTESQAKIDTLVSQMGEMKDIILFVEGHADRSGPVDYNKTLSRSRAENVRTELVRQGMNVSKIDSIELTGRGESEPAVATPDGVKAEANRRVKITARGLVPKLVPAAQSVEQ